MTSDAKYAVSQFWKLSDFQTKQRGRASSQLHADCVSKVYPVAAGFAGESFTAKNVLGTDQQTETTPTPPHARTGSTACWGSSFWLPLQVFTLPPNSPPESQDRAEAGSPLLRQF